MATYKINDNANKIIRTEIKNNITALFNGSLENIFILFNFKVLVLFFLISINSKLSVYLVMKDYILVIWKKKKIIQYLLNNT